MRGADPPRIVSCAATREIVRLGRGVGDEICSPAHSFRGRLRDTRTAKSPTDAGVGGAALHSPAARSGQGGSGGSPRLRAPARTIAGETGRRPGAPARGRGRAPDILCAARTRSRGTARRAPAIRASRAVLARIDAAAIERLLASPPTIRSCGSGHARSLRPSMSRCSARGRQRLDGAAHGQQTRPVDVDAIDLLDLGERHRPRDGPRLDDRRQRSRSAASSRFESSTSGMRVPGARMTAAAATGPASGLMPASSTPAIRADAGRTRASFSWRSIVRSRWPSARFSRRRRAMASRMARAPARGSAASVDLDGRGQRAATIDIAGAQLGERRSSRRPVGSRRQRSQRRSRRFRVHGRAAPARGTCGTLRAPR